jgi:hypothetical protein
MVISLTKISPGMFEADRRNPGFVPLEIPAPLLAFVSTRTLRTGFEDVALGVFYS